MGIGAGFAAHRGQIMNAATPGDMRRQARRACDLACSITTSHGDARIRVIDISMGGVGFMADPVLALRPADSFTLRHARLGHVRCTVRWALHSRYGASFNEASQTSDAVRRFYDSLPPGPEKTG